MLNSWLKQIEANGGNEISTVDSNAYIMHQNTADSILATEIAKKCIRIVTDSNAIFDKANWLGWKFQSYENPCSEPIRNSSLS